MCQKKGVGAATVGLCSGKVIKLNPKYNKDSRELVATDQGWGVRGWTIIKRKHQG